MKAEICPAACFGLFPDMTHEAESVKILVETGLLLKPTVKVDSVAKNVLEQVGTDTSSSGSMNACLATAWSRLLIERPTIGYREKQAVVTTRAVDSRP